MSFYFFGSDLEVKNLNSMVLLQFRSNQKDGKVDLRLNSLRFFRDKSSLEKYCKRKSLEMLVSSPKRAKINMESIFTLKDRIMEYSQGKRIDLAEISQKMNLLEVKALFQTEFSRKVIRYLLNNVKYGDTVSYSGIGNGIDSRAYQAIGTVLKSNPLPLIIPCHRVIRKDGTIGGFMGKSQENNGWEINLKKKLLELET